MNPSSIKIELIHGVRVKVGALRVEWACRACGYRFVAPLAAIEQGGGCPECHTVWTPFGASIRPAYGDRRTA